MITIPISASVTGGTAPYTFTFASNNSNVTFSDVTGTAISIGNGEYAASTDVEYTYQSDIDTAIVSVTFVDANGCSTTLSPVVIENPCDLQSTISTNGEFVFVATTTGGSGTYTYQWNYDTTLFTKKPEDINDDDNYLSLELDTTKPLPISTTIQVVITDATGCTLQKNYSYSFCRPTHNTSRRLALVCDTTPVTGCSDVVQQYRNLDLNPDITLCASQVLDWTTVSFNVPTGICVQHLGNGIITITSNLSTSQTKSITYTVKTTSGITSTTGTITVTLNTCEQGRESFDGTPQTIQLTADDSVSDLKYLSVDDRVSGTPDWSTFTFTNTPSWGNVTFNGNRDIVYEITDLSTTTDIPDVIKWSLNDYEGGQINITDTVLRDVVAVPSTVADTVCVACGTTSDPTDVLANDTGDIDRSTLTMVLVDTDVVVVKDTDNNLTFTVSPTVQGFSNPCQYKVANTQGAFSADTNILVKTACGGLPDHFDLTCELSKTFDLADRFIDPLYLAVLFSETTTVAPTYTTQGGSIVNPTTVGTVDFTTIDEGRTYTFQIRAENTSGCTGTYAYQEVNIYNGTTPFISIDSATDNGNNTSTYTGTYSGLTAPLAATLNGNPATYQSGIIANNGAFTFTLYNVAGLNTVVVSSISVCGNALSDTDASITV